SREVTPCVGLIRNRSSQAAVEGVRTHTGLSHTANAAAGGRDKALDHLQNLRDRSAEFADLAVSCADPMASQAYHELASACREAAARLQRGVLKGADGKP